MSTETIPPRGPKQLSDQEWYEILKRVLSFDLVPRNSSGVATDLGGNLGADDLRWLFLRIASGHWSAGDIKVIHPYGGEASPGHGWMLMDGRTIGQTAYETEHGAGTWATYIVSSPLDGKKLPSMNNVFPSGTAATTQDGSGAFTTVGNANHQANLQHSHQVLKIQAGVGSDDFLYDATGAQQTFSTIGAGASSFVGLTDGSGNIKMPDMWTDQQLSTAQGIKPECIPVQFYMRII